jgi:cellulase/cellobiase CelA1
MKLQDLQEIKSELKRFSDTLEEAISLAKKTQGWGSSVNGTTYGKHDISGTRMSGAVKRRALDLKHYLTKKL